MISPPKRLPLFLAFLSIACVITVVVGFLTAAVGSEGDNVNTTMWFVPLIVSAVATGCAVSLLGAQRLLTRRQARSSEVWRLLSSVGSGAILSILVLTLYISAYILTFALGWADAEFLHFKASMTDSFGETGYLALYIVAVVGGLTFGFSSGFLVWGAYFVQGLWFSSSTNPSR